MEHHTAIVPCVSRKATYMADKAKRLPILTRLFLHDSSNHPKPRVGLDVNEIIFKYQDETETRVPLSSYCPGGVIIGPGVARAAMAFGINTSAGNTVGALDREKDEITGGTSIHRDSWRGDECR